MEFALFLWNDELNDEVRGSVLATDYTVRETSFPQAPASGYTYFVHSVESSVTSRSKPLHDFDSSLLHESFGTSSPSPLYCRVTLV